MKHVINMKKAISMLSLLVLTALIYSCTPSQGPESPDVPKENGFQVKFKATPDSFSGFGGYGEVSGVLQEVSPEGKIVHETPLKASEFQLSIGEDEKNSGEFSLSRYRRNEFSVKTGWRPRLFNIGAVVTSGKGKGCKQTITVLRGGTNFSFRAEPNLFTSKGGSGEVIGTMSITDFYGNVVEERDHICIECFDIKRMDDIEGITIDYHKKTFTVAEGGATTFKLEAITGYGKPQVLVIKREG